MNTVVEDPLQRIDRIEDRRNRLPVENLRWDIDAIVAACNRFYVPKLRKELTQLQERGYLDTDWRVAIEKLLQGSLSQRLQNNRVFLLRIGRHSGAESVTLDGICSIKILLGKDIETGKQRSEYRSTGTSWWLAADGIQSYRGLLPFGWVLVELQPEESEPQEWLEVKEILDSLTTDYLIWIEREREQVRQLEEVESQHQAAAQAQREAEAIEATLSNEQKNLRELQRWFEEDQAARRKEPGGRLANRLNELVKAGSQWPAQERTNLASLAEAIYGYLGWGSGAKKQERKAKIQALKQQA